MGLLEGDPRGYLHHAHHWLILHGRYICQARKPKCDVCVVCDLCTSRGQMVRLRPAEGRRATKGQP